MNKGRRQFLQRVGALSLGAVAPLTAANPAAPDGSKYRWRSALVLNAQPNLQHPTFGLCHVRVQTWLPFTVEVWLNGREWLARQMTDAIGENAVRYLGELAGRPQPFFLYVAFTAPH